MEFCKLKHTETSEYRIEFKKSAVQKKFLFFDTNGKLKRVAIKVELNNFS